MDVKILATEVIEIDEWDRASAALVRNVRSDHEQADKDNGDAREQGGVKANQDHFLDQRLRRLEPRRPGMVGR